VGGDLTFFNDSGNVVDRVVDYARQPDPGEPDDDWRCAERWMCRKIDWARLEAKKAIRALLRITGDPGKPPKLPCEKCWPMLEQLSQEYEIPIDVEIYQDSDTPIQTILNIGKLILP